MGFFDRIKNGWQIAKLSFRTINENRTLLLFPLISTVSLVLVLLTFFGGFFFLIGDSIDAIFADNGSSDFVAYALIFMYYLINYFVIVFFNAALIHCAIDVFEGRKPSLGEGIRYASSKLGKIFGWAVVSATVGLILQIISESGKIGEFIASLLGGAWSVMTFFVVPILIYEEKDVISSAKESFNILKNKWGESLAGSFSFGIIRLLGILAGICVFMLLQTISPILGMILAGIIIIMTIMITAAAKTVFVAAVYNRVKQRPTGHFDTDTLDGIFFRK